MRRLHTRWGQGLARIALLTISLLVTAMVQASTFMVGGVIVQVSDRGFTVVVTEVVYVNGATAVGDVVHFSTHKRSDFTLPMSFVVDGHAVSREAALQVGRQFFFFAKGGGFAAATCARDADHGFVKEVQGDSTVLSPLAAGPQDLRTLTMADNAEWVLDGASATRAALQPGAWVTRLPAQPLQVFAYSKEQAPDLAAQPEVHQHSGQGTVTAVVDAKTYTVSEHGAAEPRTLRLRNYVVQDGLAVDPAAIKPGREILAWCYRNRKAANFIGISNDKVSQGAFVNLDGSALTFETSANEQQSVAIDGNTVWYLDGKPVDSVSGADLAWVQIVEPRTERWEIRHFPLQEKTAPELLSLLDSDGANDAAWQLARIAHLLSDEDLTLVLKTLPTYAGANNAGTAKGAALTLARLAARHGRGAQSAVAGEALMQGFEAVYPRYAGVTHDGGKAPKELDHATKIISGALLRYPEGKSRFAERVKTLGATKLLKHWFK